MKAIILAAGRGTRISKITKKKPKCLINIKGKSILSRQISFLKKLKINKIIVIRGYKKKFINYKNIKYIDNKDFKKNEQLGSLLHAKSEFNDDMLISFSDIIYDFKVLKKIFHSRNGEIILGIDKKWKKRYEFRYDHPYQQADKIQLGKKNEVLKIGKSLKLKKTEAEFLGILKLTKKGCKIFMKNYLKISKKKIKKMQIHDYLNFLIKRNIKINSCNIKGKFMEIDTYNDFKLAKKMFH